MTKFQLGLIGAGRMGQVHLRAVAQSESVAIVAVAEPSEAIRASLAGAGRAVYADAAAMIDACGLDGVLIATPTRMHLATVTQVAASGLSILCEKPCGMTAAQASAAAEIADRAGVRLQVAYWRRFVPELKALKQRIAAGLLGELHLLSCFQWDEEPPALSFRAGSGGILIDMGVHEFDQMRWLTGGELENYRATASKVAADGAAPEDPDAVQVLCDLSRGGSGLVSLGRRFTPGDACWAQAFGTHGFEECRFLWPPAGNQTFLAALKAQVEDFSAAVRGNASEAATAADAVAALSAAEAAMKALGSDD